jgi:hypothetical protein
MNVHNKMDQLFAFMISKGDLMMKDLEYVQNFDFDKATAEELEKFQEYLGSRIKDAEKTKETVSKVREKLEETK